MRRFAVFIFLLSLILNGISFDQGAVRQNTTTTPSAVSISHPALLHDRTDAIREHRASRAAHRKILVERKAAYERKLAHEARERKLAHKRALARAARERAREQARQKAREHAKVVTHTAPSGIAACIRRYESNNDYRAENPTSSASGAYQFIDGTWRSLTGRSDRAKDAPPSVQDAAFFKLWAGGSGAHHWVTAHRCGY